MKTCVKCKKEKSETDFCKNKQNKDGLNTECKSCRKLYRQKNKIKISESSKKYAETHKAHIQNYRKQRITYFMWLNAKHRAKQKNIEFTIKETDIYIPKQCPICQISLQPAYEKYNNSSPSLDRTNPAEGYIVSNIAVICDRCNRVKRDGTSLEHENIAKYMKQLNL